MPCALRLAVLRARIAAGLPARRRGGQPGNSNRLIHGRYARRFLLRRAHVRGLLRDARAVIAELNTAARRLRARRDETTPHFFQSHGSNALRWRAKMPPWPF
jgi:hypothetical protein